MNDPSELQQNLVHENTLLKQRVKELEQSEIEHRRIERQLLDSDQFFRSIVEKSYVGIYAADENFRFTYVNDKLCEFSGYGREELLEMDLRCLLAEESLSMVTDRYIRRRKGEKIPSWYEFVSLQKNGTKRPFASIAYVVTYAGGQVRTIGQIVDISERKQAEEMSRESEEKFAKVFMTVPDGVSISRMTDGLVLDANIGFKEISGWDRREILGRTSASVNFWVDPSEREFLVANLKTGRDVVQREFRFRHKDGQVRTGIYSARPIQIATEECLIFLMQDISERRRIEEALLESEAKYRLLAEQSLMGIHIVQDGLVKYVNQATSDITGYSREEMLSWCPNGFAVVLHPDDMPFIMEQARKKQSGDPNVIIRYEWRIVTKSGLVRHIESFSKTVIFEGKPADFVMMIDVTDRHEAKEKQKALEERLSRAEKMEALGTLAGGVAHDLNNVLGVVTGYAELLLMEVDKESPVGSRLSNIKEGGQRAAAIVQDLLTLARRGVTGRKVLNLNKIITDCQHSLEFEKLYASCPNVRIETDLEPDLLNISGSFVHLGKSLFNLVSNAIEAMTMGGGVIIRTANQYIDQPIQGYDQIREGDYVILTVSDTGEGISADDLQRIFEPFYTKKVMGRRSGTGLGLAVVWGTVKDHNGYINVQSEQGKGSTFTLYFPVTREDISAQILPISISEYMGKGETLLVVDDIKGQRDLAADMLRKLHYNVVTASSGEEAIAYLAGQEADLMVLDMIMDPGMDGLDTYRRVLEIRPKQKAIILSGFAESERVHSAQALGAGTYVRKPYVIEKLGVAVRKELDG